MLDLYRTPDAMPSSFEEMFERVAVMHPTQSGTTDTRHTSNRCLIWSAELSNVCSMAEKEHGRKAARSRNQLGTSRAAPPPRRKLGRPSAAEIAAQLGDASVSALPDGPADADGLTRRQRRILEVIKAAVESRGYPPSIREMGEAVGLASSSSVAHQLRALEQKGFLRRDPNRPRALEVLLPGDAGAGAQSTAHVPLSVAHQDETGIGDAYPAPVHVPVVGRIAAGGPILAEERIEDVFALPRQLVGEGTMFLLEVRGDSMIDAAICDGDWVVVRQQPTADNGDIVAALLDDEATVKTF